MTDQNAIVKAGQPQFAIIDPTVLANRLANMIVNGKKLLPDERIALAQYAVATDLNPFVGECYFLPGIGPGPGIAGWRKKADEQLAYEAAKARIPNAHTWCEYVTPEEGEGRYDASKGDIAVKAILHDSITHTEWEQRVLRNYIELAKAGLKDCMPAAKELTGSEPTWSAIGVVRGGENFGGVEKMDRYERACKRAEKAAIRKRFPRVYLPEPENFDAVDAQDVGVTIRDIPSDPNQILAELGYDQFQGEPPDEPEAEVPASLMTYDMAKTFVTSDNELYDSLSDDKLAFMRNSIDDVLARGGRKVKGEMVAFTAQEIEERKMKRDAIKVILAHRKAA